MYSPLFIRRLWQIITIGFVIFASYLFVTAIITRLTTGVLTVLTNDQSAYITVTQDGHSAAELGVNSTKSRLKPGTYTVSAADGTYHGALLVTIKKGQTTNIAISVKTPLVPPSVSNITFTNTSELLNQGLTAGQLSNFKEAVFAFDSNAKNVTINTNSVQSGPHDQLAGTFSLLFTVKIDSKSYNAALKYGLSDSVSVTLVDTSNGKTVYSAVSGNTGATQQSIND